MQNEKDLDFGRRVDEGVKIAVAEAIEEHRRLGHSIVIWRDGKVVTLTADEIPPLAPTDENGGNALPPAGHQMHDDTA